MDSTTQRLKVADFGCARVIEDDHDGSCYRGDANAGTLHYNPPEVCCLLVAIFINPSIPQFYREFRSGFSMDVWQAGCCFLAMVTGRRPWRCLYADSKGPREMKEWQRQQVWSDQSECSVRLTISLDTKRTARSHDPLVPGASVTTATERLLDSGIQQATDSERLLEAAGRV